MTPYYERGGVTIYHGDCRDVLSAIESGTHDITLTDAPYNGDLKYGPGTDDSRPWDEYLAWLDSIIAACERVSRGPVLCFVSKPGLLGMAQRRAPWWIGQWVGAAGNPAGPNQGLMFQPGYEPCLFYGNRYGLKACIPDVWTCSPEAERLGHPCPKPLRFMKTILAQLKPSSVVDPFMGSGTTLVAAKQFGMRATGVEIEERYCEIAAKRLQQDVLPLEVPA